MLHVRNERRHVQPKTEGVRVDCDKPKNEEPEKSTFHEFERRTEIHVEDFFTFQVFRFSRLGVLASLAISVFACVYIVV